MEVTAVVALTATRSNDCSPVYRASPAGRPFTVKLPVRNQSHVGALVPMGNCPKSTSITGCPRRRPAVTELRAGLVR